MTLLLHLVGNPICGDAKSHNLAQSLLGTEDANLATHSARDVVAESTKLISGESTGSLIDSRNNGSCIVECLVDELADVAVISLINLVDELSKVLSASQQTFKFCINTPLMFNI